MIQQILFDQFHVIELEVVFYCGRTKTFVLETCTGLCCGGFVGGH
jgi:hypothetical protein